MPGPKPTTDDRPWMELDAALSRPGAARAARARGAGRPRGRGRVPRPPRLPRGGRPVRLARRLRAAARAPRAAVPRAAGGDHPRRLRPLREHLPRLPRRLRPRGHRARRTADQAGGPPRAPALARRPVRARPGRPARPLRRRPAPGSRPSSGRAATWDDVDAARAGAPRARRSGRDEPSTSSRARSPARRRARRSRPSSPPFGRHASSSTTPTPESGVGACSRPTRSLHGTGPRPVARDRRRPTCS